MPLVAVLATQPAPGLMEERGELRHGGRTELRVPGEEADDLQRVHVADDTDAASPWRRVAVRRDDVPPQAHLLPQARPQRGQDVFAPGGARGDPQAARVLVRIAVVTAYGRLVVGVDLPARELACGQIEQIVQHDAVLPQADVVSDGGDAGGDAVVVFRQRHLPQRLRLGIVEARGVEQRAPLRPLGIVHRLPHGVRREIGAEGAEGDRRIELRERDAAAARLEEPHARQVGGEIAAGDTLHPRQLTVHRESAHERAPRELARRQRAPHTIGRRVEGGDGGHVGRQLGAEEILDLAAQLGRADWPGRKRLGPEEGCHQE
jgi:hypothetical protein